MFDLEAKLKTLPEKPGVYIMHGQNDEIIYVGKAKVLKNRVRQYFKNHNHPPKVRAMVNNIRYFEYIISDSELEALILENNLIKKHMPKYNILLKDDKTYPFLKVTLNEDFPRIFVTRHVKRDGAKYFGPYQSGLVIRDLVELIREIFMIRCCNKPFTGDFTKQRPCLYYHLGKCVGVCNKNITKEKYREIINDVCSFLNGKYDKVYKELTAQMNDASENLDFERAAIIRDRIKSVQVIGEKQKIVTANGNDIDALAMYNANNMTCIEMFFIRSGNMIGKEHYFINDTDGMEEGKILSEFMTQYYDTTSFVPREILTQYQLEDADTIGQWLTAIAGRNVTVRVPKIGEHAKLISMIAANAKKEHSEYELRRMRANDFINTALTQLTDMLNLENPPMLIEAYDISNISGTSKVGSMVTFKNGKSYKNGYRNFKINSVKGQDDYACMHEVLVRRFSRGIEEKKKISQGLLSEEKSMFSQFPDVVFVDGGSGHVSVANSVIKELNLDIPVFGIVKDDTHSTRGLVSPEGEVSITAGSEAFMLLTNIQDEMHRRAITYHRSIRNAKALESELLKIKGVGQMRRKSLLKHFGTVAKIKKASVDELCKVDGIDYKTANNIVQYFTDGGDKK